MGAIIKSEGQMSAVLAACIDSLRLELGELVKGNGFPLAGAPLLFIAVRRSR